MDLEKFAKEFNKAFGPPFLPEGFATARITDYGNIWIEVGDRDAEFNAKGEREGSGTNVGDAVQWNIERKK